MMMDGMSEKGNQTETRGPVWGGGGSLTEQRVGTGPFSSLLGCLSALPSPPQFHGVGMPHEAAPTMAMVHLGSVRRGQNKRHSLHPINHEHSLCQALSRHYLI